MTDPEEDTEDEIFTFFAQNYGEYIEDPDSTKLDPEHNKNDPDHNKP